MSVSAKNGRRATKRDRVVHEFSRLIQAGELAPGTRLPNRRELEARFGVTTATLQQAFDRLKRDGFVVTRGCQGTYVADHPPCLNRYGLLFPDHPAEGRWSRFYTALREMTEALAHETAHELPVYYNIRPPADGEPCRRLVADLRARRVAGLIFANHPFELDGSEVIELARRFPCVSLMSDQSPAFPEVRAVYGNSLDLIDRALERLAAEGRRRIALLTRPQMDGNWVPRLQQTAAALGLEIRPAWILGLEHTAPDLVMNGVDLLMSPAQPERPDGLLVVDDHLLGPVVAGLVRAGVRVPEDLGVVSHANFPYHEAPGLPVTRLGWPARRLLETCITTVDRLRRGEEPPAVQSLPAIFEEEWLRQAPALTGTDA